MDWGMVGAIIGSIAVFVGIVAGIVQVLDYIQKQREKEIVPAPLPAVKEPPAPTIPSNLPPRGEFIGREREKAQVREALASRSFLISIDGIGGIGKTALALEIVHECLKASKGEEAVGGNGVPIFDAFVWATAKDRELILSDILDTIARTLDYPYITQLPPEEKGPELAKLLRGQRCLLIVDNFETITDDAVAHFLTNLPEPSKALITSREQKLRQARAISLKGMDQSEALALIRNEGKRLGLESVERAEEKVLLRLYEATGGAPLAIKWAVGQIKQRGQSLDTVLDALYGARGDIFEEIFSRSWSLLSEPARRVLMVMPIFATSASKAAIEAASDVHKWDLDEGLGQLVEMWLVEASSELDEAKRRYSVHPLTRAFAARELGKDTEFEREVRLRVAGHFLDLLRQYGGENWQGYDIVELDLINILAIMDWCCETDDWRALIDFVNSLNYFLEIRGYWDERIRYGQRAMQASENLGDMQSFAWIATFVVGWTSYWQGYTEQAKELTMKALRISEEHNYHEGIAMALCNLGRFAYPEGEFDRAQQWYAKGLKLWEQIGNQKRIAMVRKDLGTIALYQGDMQEAKRQFEEAQRQFEEIGNTQGLAATYHRLGNLAEQQGDYGQAQWFYEEYLTLAQEIGMLSYVGNAKSGLAVLKEQQQDYEEALALAREADEIYQRLGYTAGIEQMQELVERLEKRVEERRR